jgi:hypothetical protein
LLAGDLYLPQGPSLATQDVSLTGRVLHAGAEEIALELGTDRLAHAVRIEAGDWQVADNYMHIAPGRHVVVRAAGRAETRPSAIVARAFNGRASLRVSIPSVPAD